MVNFIEIKYMASFPVFRVCWKLVTPLFIIVTKEEQVGLSIFWGNFDLFKLKVAGDLYFPISLTFSNPDYFRFYINVICKEI